MRDLYWSQRREDIKNRCFSFASFTLSTTIQLKEIRKSEKVLSNGLTFINDTVGRIRHEMVSVK